MLTLCRYPGEAIILEYGNTLELLYVKYKRVGGTNKYIFQIYINNDLKLTTDKDIIEFTDDNIDFAFYINARGIGHQARAVGIHCPNFVHIRRKEIPPKKVG